PPKCLQCGGDLPAPLPGERYVRCNLCGHASPVAGAAPNPYATASNPYGAAPMMPMGMTPGLPPRRSGGGAGLIIGVVVGVLGLVVLVMFVAGIVAYLGVRRSASARGAPGSSALPVFGTSPGGGGLTGSSGSGAVGLEGNPGQ